MSAFEKILHAASREWSYYPGGPMLPQIDTPVAATYSGSFSLSDPHACSACAIAGCDNITLTIASRETLNVLNIDGWSKALPARLRDGLKNCDYFIFDDERRYACRKIAFCDLTCSEEKFLGPGVSKKYPEGKRIYAFRQMEKLFELFCSDDMLLHYMLTTTHRRYVLGVRLKDDHNPSVAASAMHRFATTPASRAHTLASLQATNKFGFEYVEVRHPAPLVW